MKRAFALFCGIVAILTGFALSAGAQDNQNYNSLIQNLVPPNGPDLLNFRGGPRLHTITLQKSVQPGKAAEAASEGFDIEFGPGATALSDSDKAVIRSHSADFAAPAAADGYILEGHTDASGSHDENVTISQRRAEAVRDYLVQAFGLNPALIQVVGRGEAGLLDPEHPQSGVNRRVHVGKSSH